MIRKLLPALCAALLAAAPRAHAQNSASAMSVIATGATTPRTLAAMAADTVNVADFGAVPDMAELATGAYTIAAGSRALASSANGFAAGMVGKTIVLPGAGAGGAGLVSVIAGYTDAAHVTLAIAARTGLAAARATPEIGTDSTAAINRAIAAAETRNGPANYNVGTVSFPDGMYLVRTVNLAGFGRSSLKIAGQGILWGVAAGEPVVDALGSRWLRWSGVGIIGDRYAMPSAGLQIGRTGSTASSSADNSSFDNFLISGSYTVAALLNEQSETTAFNKIHFYNNNTRGYAVAMDGYHHFPAHSPAIANREPADVPQSFNENVFIDCIFGAYTPLWLGNTGRMTVIDGYLVAGGPYGVVLYGEPGGDNIQLDLDIHMETPTGTSGMTDAFFLTGTNPTPFLEGFRWRENGSLARQAMFKVDPASSIRSISMPNADIDIRDFAGGATKMFDDPAPWRLVTGRIHVPVAADMNLGTAFQGWLSTIDGMADRVPLDAATLRAGLATMGVAVGGDVGRVDVASGGNYYVTGASYTPSLAFAAAPRGGITAAAHVDGLYVAGEGELGHAGRGYRVAPDVAVEDPNGTTLFHIGIASVGAGGAITAISLRSPQPIATTIPAALRIVQPGGAGGTMSGTNFGVASVAIDNPGAGYDRPPAVTFSAQGAAPPAAGTAIPAGVRIAATAVTTQPGRYTFATADCGSTVEYTGTANVTWTVPRGLGTGCAIAIVQKSTGAVTFAGAPGIAAAEYVRSGPRRDATAGPSAEARLLVDGVSTFLLTGEVE